MAHDQTLSRLGLLRRNVLAGAALGGAGVLLSQVAGVTPAQAASHGGNPLGMATSEIDVASLPRIKQKLVPPPGVPEHEQVASTGPVIVEVEMTITEKKIQIDDDGATIWAFAFEGSVPGPLIVCHQGDYVELTLRNAPGNMMEHNIDFHAATGAMGGGEISLIQPGEQVVFRFRALKAGVFVYHCAPGGEMIPYHVCHGMNGAIMVLPRGGLVDGQGNPLTYDRAIYIGEQDFYLAKDENGAWRDYEGAMDDFGDSLEVMRGLIPTHVVFNGARGAVAGDNAIQAKVGENVLIIHAQANRDSRPHLIGGHGEYVWETGSFNDAPATDNETWFIRGGSAGAAMYRFMLPGMYAYVTHNLIEAVLLGAVAHFKVDGAWDDKIMMQVSPPMAY